MNLYGDWDFLLSIGLALNAAAPEPLPHNRLATLAELQAEAAGFGLDLPDPAFPEARQIKSLKSKLDQRRAKLVNEVMRHAMPRPDAWTQLSERLALDADPYDQRREPAGHPLAARWPDEEFRIRECFARSPFYRGAPNKEEIRINVTAKLYFVVIRNAEKWYGLGNYDTEWWGYVFRQLPSLIRRASP